jgi:hypothetical protein
VTDPSVPDDFIDFVACLRAEGCAFLIVGAHALAAHGVARATGDLDVLIRPDASNAVKVFKALARFGAPVAAHGIGPEDFAKTGVVYQMGLPPNRIDILTSISGVSFKAAERGAVEGHLGSEMVRCIGLAPLLRNKRASGRPKDLADVAALEELHGRVPRPKKARPSAKRRSARNPARKRHGR